MICRPLPEKSLAICNMPGTEAMQGPHHDAQKSTSVSFSCFTSCEKVLSVPSASRIVKSLIGLPGIVDVSSPYLLSTDAISSAALTPAGMREWMSSIWAGVMVPSIVCQNS